MPMYEFVCGGCRHQFEELVMTSDEAVPCPKCGSQDVGKILSTFAFKSGDVFKSTAVKSGCAGCSPGAGCAGCKH
ncbi:MAG: zinc ribbon domain-containing protein [Deltaproteobacteria bacterium]|nr:zinc ribbon domain-containing protein [Deltaproteobacteria bacterium]